MQGLVTVGVYKDVDVSAEIDGLSNMQDIAEAGSQQCTVFGEKGNTWGDKRRLKRYAARA